MNKLAGLVAAGFAALLLIQLIPYGKEHVNPPVVNEPAWDTPRTRDLFFAACRDCHSNETNWPWYSSIAPASWLVYQDVEEGREEFNVSQWSPGGLDTEEVVELVREGEMPPWFYLPAHPEAMLDGRDKQDLIRGLLATFDDEDEGATHAHHERSE